LPPFENLHPFQHDSETFFFGFENSKMAVVVGARKVPLISDIAAVMEPNFRGLNTANGNLIL